LDDDLARMYLELSSSEKEISDDDMNLEVWYEIELESDSEL
jgi:hypothetical protein